MTQDQLQSLLETLTGHLHTSSEKEEQVLNQIQEQVAASLINQSPSATNQQFSFEKSDFFFRQNIKGSRLSKLQEIAARTLKDKQDNDLRVFVRDVPVRTTQVKGSVPEWAAGAKPVKSAGPFLSKEGRHIWLDFYRVEKLIAIYIQGQTLPAILFRSAFRKTLYQMLQNAHVELVTNFDLLPGSVWINAHILCPDAPSDRYAGVKVKGGTVTLDSLPFLVGENITVSPANNIRVSLQLEQRADDDADASSAYGRDARNAQYELPAVWNFTLNGFGKNITAIGDATALLYGQEIELNWKGNQATLYNTDLSRLLIPWSADISTFKINSCKSPFCTISGDAPITESWWGLPCAVIEINTPLEAEGNGAVLIQCDKGFTVEWRGLQNQDMNLSAPLLIGEPGRIGITDLESNAMGASQHFDLWKDTVNPHGSSADLLFLANSVFIFNTISIGDEILMTLCDASLNIDRPVKVNGEPFDVHSKNSLLALAANDNYRLIYLYDDNIIWDNTIPTNNGPNEKLDSIALLNALFTVSPVNGCLLFGSCNEDWKKITTANLFLIFGMYSYLPTLPDPYLVNLGVLQQQLYSNKDVTGAVSHRRPWLWLICNIQYKPESESADEVNTAFHFGPAPTESSTQSAQSKSSSVKSGLTQMFAPQASTNENAKLSRDATAFAAMVNRPIPNYDEVWNEDIGAFEWDYFALMDVSSHANQLGVSFGDFGGERYKLMRTAMVVSNEEGSASVTTHSFPFIVDGMEVKAAGASVRAFLEPQVAWEPVFNLTEPDRDDPNDPASPKLPMDPEAGFLYFPNDGGATRIYNNSTKPVALAPIPLVNYLIDYFKNDPKSILASTLTLSFGLKALAYITKNKSFVNQDADPDIKNNRPLFRDDLQGGIQISVYSGDFGKPVADPADKDSPMLPGYTLQLNNLLEADGTAKGASNLGHRVSQIFNNEFFITPIASGDINDSRGVPVKRIDFTGYGINMFSNWLSPTAAMAQTSQAKFDIMFGRTSHEVIQVKSILYPWGIRVVRTITLFRASTGYVYRYDSGWKAESDGKFDFSYKYVDINGVEKTINEPYEFHPGIISGLYNVRNIKDAPSVAEFNTSNFIANGAVYINGVKGREQWNLSGHDIIEPVKCGAVYFDADIAVENVKQGHQDGRVVSKKVLGYVQLAPAGKPLSTAQFRALMMLQNDTIGADVDCTIDINNSNQQMRLSRIDVNPSLDASNNTIFVVAARGNVSLPKDGSWSMVQHEVGTGDVVPLPANLPVPLIRIGKWVKDKVIDPVAVTKQLLRIAHPKDILKAASADTINFGYLQNTTTQKVLFLTPSYGLDQQKLLSKTPPIFADAYRMMTGKAIFPNIGDGITNFGKAMPMLSGTDSLGNAVQAFKENILEDGGQKVLELMEVEAKKVGDEVVQQGMNLLKKGANGLIDKALKFDVPDFNVPLVDMDALKIYVEYKTGKKGDAPGNYVKSKLDFDIDSFPPDLPEKADQWKSRLNNLAMVVDLGPMKRLMTIKGNFNSKKGKETGYEGDGDGGDGLPTPEVEFSDALKPVIAILEMLAALSTGDYADALKKGLKVAMSNAGEIWEYKFEAKKEIGLIRFPPSATAYESSSTPLKLEASLSLGVYLDAALKVTTDPKQLLPTAGAFLQFHGGLSVLCFSVGGGSIFATGTVDVKIACDTKIGPSLDLKFGFGAQLVVGFPVIGNVSVTFMVGIDMHADTGLIKLAALMYFRGHADIFGGIVSITITIEAKGIIERDVHQNRTDCSAQVTFALDISIFLVIDISFTKTWGEDRQVAAADEKYGS